MVILFFLVNYGNAQTEQILLSYEKDNFASVEVNNFYNVDFKLENQDGQLSLFDEGEYKIVQKNNAKSFLVNDKDEVLLTIISYGGIADVIKFPNGKKFKVRTIKNGYKLIDQSKETVATVAVANGSKKVLVDLNIEDDSYESQLLKTAMVLSLDKFQTYSLHPSQFGLQYIYYSRILNDCE